MALWIGLRFISPLVTLYVTRLPSGHLFISEDPQHPRLIELRNDEHIDQVILNTHSDMERLLRLTQWSSQQFQAASPFPHYPPWDAKEILQRIRSKQTGGFCAQYAFVFGQVCQSLGYNVRYVGIATRTTKDGHSLIEVYVPSISKWVIFEPEFGRYYADAAGRPLSALDLHLYAIGSKKGRVSEVPSGQTIESRWLDLFYNFKYMLRNNFISVPVYHIYQSKPKGAQLVFERYQLRWLDRFTATTPEAMSSLTSQRVEDFEFPMDLTGRAEEVRCSTSIEFAAFARRAVPLKLYKLKMTQPLLLEIIEGVFIQDPRFKPLK